MRSGGKGLVVPVIRNAERLSFAQVEQTIVEYAVRAKANKLTIDEMTGGTFTISNGGVYGSLLSTPIVNPPQSGILGLHGIQERPIALNGEVVIQPMMYIALTYDHRIVDGREAVFLSVSKSVLKHLNACFWRLRWKNIASIWLSSGGTWWLCSRYSCRSTRLKVACIEKENVGRNICALDVFQ